MPVPIVECDRRVEEINWRGNSDKSRSNHEGKSDECFTDIDDNDSSIGSIKVLGEDPNWAKERKKRHSVKLSVRCGEQAFQCENEYQVVFSMKLLLRI